MQTITMTPKELIRYETIKDLIAKRIKEKQAGVRLRLSTRQIRRLKKAVAEKDVQGIIHKNRGQESHNKLDHKTRDLVTLHIKKEYPDFGPTLATEKLAERNRIKLSIPTVRQIMIEEGIWKSKGKNKIEYHALRDRREFLGELVQFDGSYHDWFENGEKHCLLGGIDDATGKTYARFAAHEDSKSVLGYWKEYFVRYGKPVNIYVDKLNTYKVNIKTAPNNLSQFERAMKELGIEVIHAHSPEAKGRIERLFETFQDRLIKEMRLERIKDPKSANKFLEKVFLPKFNKRFNVIARGESDLHKKLNIFEEKNLDKILSVQNRRCVNNDFTIRFQNKWYQLGKEQPITIRKGDDVIIEERTNGKIYLRKDDKYLNYKALEGKPAKILQEIKEKREEGKRKGHPVPKDHPWRQGFQVKTRETEPIISYTY